MTPTKQKPCPFYAAGKNVLRLEIVLTGSPPGLLGWHESPPRAESSRLEDGLAEQPEVVQLKYVSNTSTYAVLSKSC